MATIETSDTMNEIRHYFFTTKPILEALPNADRDLFKEHLRLKKIKKGRDLFREGIYPKAVYLLKRGKVKLYQRGTNGSENILYIYTPGEMFGYRPLLCNETHPATATTIEESSIYVLPSKYFVRTLEKSTALSNYLLENLSHEFTVLLNRIGAFAQKSVKERTALSLLILRERYHKPDGKGETEITLSRTDLAGFVGTTVETIARIITKLKKDKIIKTNGRRIVIVNDQALTSLMD
jgi:CRP-like cAMP-binding protein